MELTDAKLNANRQNAQLSTGPRTEEGKKRSSLNALRHGLTGEIVLLPEEDIELYGAFCRGFHEEWNPQGQTEKQLVQSMADNQWRLHRAHARERAIYAILQEEVQHPVDTDNPEVQTAVAGAMVGLDKNIELERMGRHAARIQREYMNSLKMIQQLQAERKQRQALEMEEAALLAKLHAMEETPFDPAEYGFVLTVAEIDRHNYRQDRLQNAKLARNLGWNIVKYHNEVARRSV